jgi:hypothetical protein
MTAAMEGQRLFFACAVSGFLIAAIGFPVYRRIFATVFEPTLRSLYPGSYVGELLATMIIAPVLAVLLNIGYSCRMWVETKTVPKSVWEWAFSKLTARFGNSLQRLLVEATEGQRLVLLTLTSRKVYCGMIARMPPSFKTDELYVELIPKFSATRDKDSLQLDHKLEYRAFHVWTQVRRISSLRATAKKLLTDGQDEASQLASDRAETLQKKLKHLEPSVYLDRFDIQNWIKVIPADQIESASIFDDKAPDNWFTVAAKPNHPEARPAL